LSHDLPAQVGSQLQLNVRQLISCPSLLAAALVSDPDVVIVPLQSPPKPSAVSDWLQQCKYGQPIDSKHAINGSTASDKHTESKSADNNLLPVDYGQPTESKHTLLPNKNPESGNVTLLSTENHLHETVRSEKKDFDLGQRTNDDDNGNDNSNTTGTTLTNNSSGKDDDVGKKSLLRRRQFRVSFLTDVRQNKINSVDTAGEGAKFEDENDPEVDEVATAGIDEDNGGDDGDGADGGGGGGDDDGAGGGDGDSGKSAEGKSPTSDSSSILLCSQPSSSGRSLPKASFVDLEVPDSWKARRQSQTSDSSRYSGSVDFPPASTTTPKSAGVRLHMASTPTTSVRSHQSNEGVDLSAISCSPITPRTTSDHMMKSRSHERTPSVEGQKDDDDGVTIVPCSPLTPSSTSSQQQCVDDRTCQQQTYTSDEVCRDDGDDDDDDDVTVIPCTPVTLVSSQAVKNSPCGKRLYTSVEDDKVEDEEVTIVVPSSPVSATSNQPVQNKPETGIQRLPRLKVVFCFFHVIAVNHRQ